MKWKLHKSFQPIYEEVLITTPETEMLAAIVERAFRDAISTPGLSNVSRNEREGAYEWLTNTEWEDWSMRWVLMHICADAAGVQALIVREVENAKRENQWLVSFASDGGADLRAGAGDAGTLLIN